MLCGNSPKENENWVKCGELLSTAGVVAGTAVAGGMLGGDGGKQRQLRACQSAGRSWAAGLPVMESLSHFRPSRRSVSFSSPPLESLGNRTVLVTGAAQPVFMVGRGWGRSVLGHAFIPQGTYQALL